jgi:pectate lyase C
VLTACSGDDNDQNEDAAMDTDIDSDAPGQTEQSTGPSDVGPGPCGCETPQGDFGVVDETIVVRSGETFDGECQVFYANPDTLGNGSQEEGQKPVFKVDGGTLLNVILGAPAADGIHVEGDVVLENIHWLDIGEDAMTVKAPATVHLDCGSATNGADKMFQVNDASEIHISNFTGQNAGKFMRQLGGSTFHVDVYIDHCYISYMDEVIFRTDSTTSHVTMTNTRYRALGDGLFKFGERVENGNSDQSTVENNQAY